MTKGSFTSSVLIRLSLAAIVGRAGTRPAARVAVRELSRPILPSIAARRGQYVSPCQHNSYNYQKGSALSARRERLRLRHEVLILRGDRGLAGMVWGCAHSR